MAPKRQIPVQKPVKTVQKPQISDETPGEVTEQVDPLTEIIEEVIQNMQNAIDGMNLAVAKLIEQDQGITRIVSQRQSANQIIRNLTPYIENQ